MSLLHRRLDLRSSKTFHSNKTDCNTNPHCHTIFLPVTQSTPSFPFFLRQQQSTLLNDPANKSPLYLPPGVDLSITKTSSPSRKLKKKVVIYSSSWILSSAPLSNAVPIRKLTSMKTVTLHQVKEKDIQSIVRPTSYDQNAKNLPCHWRKKCAPARNRKQTDKQEKWTMAAPAFTRSILSWTWFEWIRLNSPWTSLINMSIALAQGALAYGGLRETPQKKADKTGQDFWEKGCEVLMPTGWVWSLCFLHWRGPTIELKIQTRKCWIQNIELDRPSLHHGMPKQIQLLFGWIQLILIKSSVSN